MYKQVHFCCGSPVFGREVSICFGEKRCWEEAEGDIHYVCMYFVYIDCMLVDCCIRYHSVLSIRELSRSKTRIFPPNCGTLPPQGHFGGTRWRLHRVGWTFPTLRRNTSRHVSSSKNSLGVLSDCWTATVSYRLEGHQGELLRGWGCGWLHDRTR